MSEKKPDLPIIPVDALPLVVADAPKRRGRPKGATVANGAKRPQKKRKQYEFKDGTPVKKRLTGSGARHVADLSNFELDNALDRALTGERIATIAEEINVNRSELSKALKKRAGFVYLRTWQNSIRYDCLRVEMLLKRAFAGINDDIEGAKWGAIILRCLEYRAKILGYDNVNDATQTLRVAGMNQAEVFNTVTEIIERGASSEE